MSTPARIIPLSQDGAQIRVVYDAAGAVMDMIDGAGNSLKSRMLNSAGLVITATSGLKVPKVGATDCYAYANNTLVKIAAGTDMPTLVGTVVNATFNTYSFFVNAAGTVSVAMGTAGSTLATVVPAPVPAGSALVGHIVINPTGTGDFVGGTTGLDAGTVTPNTVYISTVGVS